MSLNISPRELKARLDAGEALTVIDVRDDWEIQLASLPGTLNIPMDDLIESLDKVPKDQPVVIMCHTGGRSIQIAYWLRAQGYANVLNLSTGIEGWSQDVDPAVPTY